MSFSYSASVITQTGTDTNISGLNGLTGVTTTDYGFYKKYRLSGTTRLVINGTLSFNTGSVPYEQIAIAPTDYSNHSIKVVGSLTIGTEQDPALQRVMNGMPSIIQEQIPVGNESLGSTNDGAGTSPNRASIYVAASATFLMYGQEMSIGSSFGISSTASSFILKDAGITVALMYNYKGGTLENVTYCGVHRDNPTTVGLLLVTPPASLLNYKKRGGGVYVGFSGAATPATTFTIFGVPSLPSSVGLMAGGRSDSLANAPIASFINLALGSDYALVDPPDTRYLKAYLKRRCILTAKDSAGAAVSGALVRVVGKAGSTVYTATTDVSGSSGNIDVDIAYFQTNGTGAGANSKTYYSLSNNITDDFKFNVFDYSTFLGILPTQILKGESNQLIGWTLFSDSYITLSKTAATALTAAATLNDLYDLAKLWKVQSANCTYPTVDTQPINGNGDTLETGAASVLIDSTAAAAFAINTGTNAITVKATALAVGSKFGYIKSTSGSITLANAAAVSCGVDLDGANLIAQDIDAVTGAISTTGTCRIDVSAPGVYPAATINATSKIRVTAATSGDIHDCRACVFASGAVFENNSGQPITVKLLPSQTTPTKLETSGTITFDNTASATFTVSNLVSGTEVRAYTGTDPATAVLIASTESSTDTFSFTDSYSGVAGYIVVRKVGYKFLKIPITYTATTTTLPVQQVVDPWYINP
jgi:hypothetical protein